MATSVTSQAPASARRIGGGPTRSVAAASWTALGALMLRDLVDLSVAEPSLETVFINLTGKELRD